MVSQVESIVIWSYCSVVTHEVTNIGLDSSRGSDHGAKDKDGIAPKEVSLSLSGCCYTSDVFLSPYLD